MIWNRRLKKRFGDRPAAFGFPELSMELTRVGRAVRAPLERIRRHGGIMFRYRAGCASGFLRICRFHLSRALPLGMLSGVQCQLDIVAAPEDGRTICS